MTDATPYNLSVSEALAHLSVQLDKMQAETDRQQLKGIDPDTAYEMGYKAAIFDLTHYTGPSPADEFSDAVKTLAEMEKKK